MIRPRELVVAQAGGASLLPVGARRTVTLSYGQGRIGVDQILAGGFDEVSLMARDLVTFDGNVDLGLRRAINLYEGALGNTRAGATVRLAAPYVLLSGRTSLLPRRLRLCRYSPRWKNGGRQARDAARLGEATISTSAISSARASGRGHAQWRHDTNRGPPWLRPGRTTQPGRSAFSSSTAAWLRCHSAAFPRPAPCSPAATCCIAGATRGRVPVRRHAAVGVRQAGAHGADGGAGRRPCAAGRDTTLDWRQHQSQRAAAAGQLTSVSARGATIPYGGTVDGLSYLYNGATVELGSVGARTASATWNTAWCLRAARSAWIRAR